MHFKSYWNIFFYSCEIVLTVKLFGGRMQKWSPTKNVMMLTLDFLCKTKMCNFYVNFDCCSFLYLQTLYYYLRVKQVHWGLYRLFRLYNNSRFSLNFAAWKFFRCRCSEKEITGETTPSVGKVNTRSFYSISRQLPAVLLCALVVHFAESLWRLCWKRLLVYMKPWKPNGIRKILI